ncbi:hypothetical protein [Candidatus Enterococcus clewellii]|uniref:Uncharacterized protein n=1 Tax=Candidatus Enterococcus clewellii TaxID=1834193 RepID=A0A242KAL9_9ENTE|nr:hypothetical protein [Enterococcus sp. 9E7_DIV0242]OTP17590.1 hypothetical protein A5888_001728 [Enterococcus sp. 9E7_DIV0242]
MDYSQTQPKINQRYHVQYTGLSFLENDMIFLKRGADLAPQRYDLENKTTGIVKNRWLVSKDNYGEFESFEHSFNKWLGTLNTGWYAHSSKETYDIHDDLRRVLTFAGVEERLSRHNDVNSTGGAYSSLARGGDAEREITYKYRLNMNILIEYMEYITYNLSWQTEKISDDVDWIDDNINKLNAAKFLRWQLNRYFEIMKQDIWNKYAGNTTDFITTEFDDVVSTADNYGIMFFLEHETSVDRLINNFPKTTAAYDSTGLYDQSYYDDGPENANTTGFYDTTDYDGSDYDLGPGVIGDKANKEQGYDSAKYDQNGDFYDYYKKKNPADVFDDSNSMDPLGSVNTSLWFAPFDISEISFTGYSGEEEISITVKIPEGVAYNNEAEIIQLGTKGKKNGAEMDLASHVNEFKTYQIDGLVHNGLPEEHIATIVIQNNSRFKTNANNNQLSIIGTDKWFDPGKVVNGQPQDTSTLGKNNVPMLVGCNLMYQHLNVFNGESGRNFITPTIFHKKLQTSGIGSLNRVKYRGRGFKIKNNVKTSTLGTMTDPPPINRALEWFEIHGGYDNTGPYKNVILGGTPGATGYGGIPMTQAHNNNVGYGAGFEVNNNILTIRLNLVGYAVDEAGNYNPDMYYVHFGGPYVYKVKLEWRLNNGTYTTWLDEAIFSHDASQDWDLAYRGTWLRTAQNSQWSRGGITVPNDANRIRMTIYGENATMVSSAEYDVTGYRPPEKVPLSIDLSDYDITLGIVAREIRHL